KDLTILRRTPAIAVLLALYPALVAVLIGLAVGKPPAKPVVAIVNEVPANERKLTIGGKKFNLDKLIKALYTNVDGRTVDSRKEALQQVRSGDAVAAVIIPRDIVTELESALGQGHLEAIFDDSDAIRKSYVETTIKGLLVDTNKELTSRFSGVALDYLDIIVNGGKIGFGSRSYKILGLKEGEDILPRVLAYIPPDQRADVIKLTQSIGLAKTGLRYSDDLLNRVGEPIKLERQPIGTNSSVPALAVAVAVCVSLMFVALLLGAGMLAFEQEDQMLMRLLRGLATRRGIVIEKTLLAALCSLVVGTVMVAAFGLFVDVRWERVWMWWPALVAAATGFGVAGVAVGAASGDVRAASLASFMLGLPLAAAALVPKGSIGPALYDVLQVISALFPFKPALDLVQAGLTPGSDALVPILHLTALVLVYGAIASWAIKRRVST
ncbi:MAG TPA: ABC transporter permease, partial [Solirubrobacterales bacterium]|nr:ABC transporter permease [Solirubrobacterales bacterium]